jgi:hypothetical protein
MTDRYFILSPRLRRMAGNQTAMKWAVFDPTGKVIFEADKRSVARELAIELNNIDGFKTDPPRTFISPPHQGVIYILEPTRRGASKLNASAMPEIVTPAMSPQDAVDRPIPYRSVPLAIRRMARKFFALG